MGGLWTKSLKRLRDGNIKCFFSDQSSEIKYQIVDEKKNIVDITGDVIIRQDDFRNGKLMIKIRRLQGNLIITVYEITPSVIPEVMTGKIIFNPPIIKEEKKSLEKEPSSYSADKTSLNKNLIPKNEKGMDDKKDVSCSKEGSDLYDKIWTELQELGYGYERGSDVPYLHFIEACETFCDVDDIDMDEFSEKYDINIG